MASGKVSAPQSWNRYTYCINNPLVYSDPTGLLWWVASGGDQPEWYPDDKPPDTTKYTLWVWKHSNVYKAGDATGGWITLDPNSSAYYRTDTESAAVDVFAQLTDRPSNISAVDSAVEMFGYITVAQGLTRVGTSLFSRLFVREAAVEVFRVEGAINTRLLINEAGEVAVQGETTLFLNFGNAPRAEAFLAKRLGQGVDDAVIKSFEVPKSFLNELRSSAVLQSEASAFPTRPFLVDVTKAGNQFGLRSPQIQTLRQNIIQGSGKISPR